MGEAPDKIREEIEEAREHMGDTLEALGGKADVKSRAKGAVAEKRDQIKERVSGVASSVSDATPDGGQIKESGRRAAGIAQENPIGLAVAGVAVGFLAGVAIPSTRVEQERMGPIASEVREKVKETGAEAVERGKQVAQEALETAKEKGQEHAEELGSNTRDRAQETTEATGQHA